MKGLRQQVIFSGFDCIEVVEENDVSPDMDVWLAFAVQDVPSEALAFSNKTEARFK
jgi:hypothetical protein